MSDDLRILLVEDDPDKCKSVVAELKRRLIDFNCAVHVAGDYNAAVSILRSSTFDVVILDLLIPISKTDPAPSLENSKTLIEMMLQGDVMPPSHIIGLTAYADAATKASAFYLQNLLSLEVYSSTTFDWADNIAGKISYISRAKLASIQFHNNNFSTDLLIVVARYENEFRPISKVMKWESPPSRKSIYFPQSKFLSGRIAVSNSQTLRATVLCVGEMGAAASASMTSQAISVYRPRIVAMLGMCCGFKSKKCASPSKLGDVLVARETASWESGKYISSNDGSKFLNRSSPRVIETPFRQLVEGAVETKEESIMPYLKSILGSPTTKALLAKLGSRVRGTPDIKIGMMVSGTSVIASEDQIEMIIERRPEALGLDMETFAVFTAAQSSVGKPPHVLAIKGVADFGTKSKNSSIQAHASTLSYKTLIAILQRTVDNPEVIPLST